MPFAQEERRALLALKGVGPTVVARLEQLGYESLKHLSRASVLDVLAGGAQLTGSSCWKNSPQARAAYWRGNCPGASRHPPPQRAGTSGNGPDGGEP